MAKKPDSAPSKKAPKKEQSAAVDSARKVVAKQRGLGRGLSSLLGDAGAAASHEDAGRCHVLTATKFCCLIAHR